MTKRKQFAVFINIATVGAVPKWALASDGFTEVKIAYRAQLYEKLHFTQSAANMEIVSYLPVMETPLTTFYGDELFSYIDAMRLHHKAARDCETECLLVYLYKDNEKGACPAEKSACCVQLHTFCSTGNENTRLTFLLHLQGAAVSGLFDPVRKTFLAND